MFLLTLIATVWAANPFRVEVQPVELTVDNQKDMVVTFVVPKGFHLYHDMMSVEPLKKEGLTFSSPVFPMGHLIADPANPAEMREVFDSTIQVTVPVQSTKVGTYMTEVKVRYQGCKDTLCYMPKSETLSTVVEVKPSLDSKVK